MSNLFVFLLIAFTSVYAVKPKSKSKVLLFAVMIPLTCQLLYACVSFFIVSPESAGRGLAESLIPSIISGIIIHYQLKRKFENRNKVRTSFALIFAMVVVSTIYGINIYYDGIAKAKINKVLDRSTYKEWKEKKDRGALY